jgi:hypothetical protein
VKVGTHLSLDAVIAFLDGQPDHIVDLVLEARATLLRLLPGVTESIHWRAISYHDAQVGGHVKGAICQFTIQDAALRISFIHGAMLPDPHNLLQGTCKAKRFVLIRSARGLREPALLHLVSSAASFVRVVHSASITRPSRSRRQI